MRRISILLYFFVADLCFVKDIIGQCSCTSLFGCYQCIIKNTEWTTKKREKGTQKTMVQTTEDGEIALKVLGENPDRSSEKFTEIKRKYCGQWV